MRVALLVPSLFGLLAVTAMLYDERHVKDPRTPFTKKYVLFEQPTSIPTITISRDVVCQHDILPPGSLHIVIAAWEYDPDFQDHFLWDTGFSNTHIFLYRRSEELKPSRHWTGPCGMAATELLLIPNRGYEAAAFLDYMTLYHDDPPLAMAFLHGHVAKSWHTSCEAILSRIALYYDGLRRDLERMPDMVTLTSRSDKSFDGLDWFGGRKLKSAQDSHDVVISATLSACRNLVTKVEQGMNMTDVLVPQVESGARRPYFSSCCANFILRGTRYRRVPLHSIIAMKDFALSASYDSKIVATHCFEFIVHSLYANPDHDVVFLREWYELATRHMKTVTLSTRAFAKCKQS